MSDFLTLNLHFDTPRCLPIRNLQRGSSQKKKKKGERTKSMLSIYFFLRAWSRCPGAQGPRAQGRGRALGGQRRPHTPGRDWPAAQSLKADTSGQPLPRSSRLLLPALGKKSGQRGAGTKDPAVHGDRGLRATPRQAPGADVL